MSRIMSANRDLSLSNLTYIIRDLLDFIHLISTVWTVPDRGQYGMEKLHFEFVVTVWTGIVGRFTHPNTEIGFRFLLSNLPRPKRSNSSPIQ